jgi:hypothetical protein
VGLALLAWPAAGQQQVPLAILSTSPLGFGVVGWKYSQILDATGGVSPYRWSLASGAIPPGVTFNPSLGLEGTPTTGGTFNFTIRVTDNAANSATKAMSIDIIGLGGDWPVITTNYLGEGVARASYQENLDALGGAPPYRWDLQSGTLPAGLQIYSPYVSSDPFWVTAVIGGTPTASGVSTFTLRATDTKGKTSLREFWMVIRPAGTVRIQSATRLGGVFVVGYSYSTTLQAVGGTSPYKWSMVAGFLPSGLTLSTDGTIAGILSEVGTYHFRVRAVDARGQGAVKDMSLVITPTSSTRWTPSSLPSFAVVGAPFTDTKAEITGGVPPITLQIYDSLKWPVQDNSPLPGLRFDPSTGTFSGTPTVPGGFLFELRIFHNVTWWNDAYVSYVTIPLVVHPRLSTGYFVSTEWLPYGTSNVAYSYALAVSGGSTPYTWELSSGGLPTGLTLDRASGTISGRPAVAGAYSFIVRATDRTGAVAWRAFVLRVNAQSLPAAIIGGLPDTATPSTQPKVDLTLASPHSAAITGTLGLSFVPDAANNSNDPAVQFSTGGRSVSFTIPAGSTQANFGTSELRIQTGTVAGIITLWASMTAGGVDLTPDPEPVRVIRVPLLAPTISSVAIRNKSTNSFEVEVIGYATSREVTQASFSFVVASGINLQGGSASVGLTNTSTTWYQGTSSTQFGSQFRYVQPFSLSQGDTSGLTSVSVTLTSARGGTQPVSANF